VASIICLAEFCISGFCISGFFVEEMCVLQIVEEAAVCPSVIVWVFVTALGVFVGGIEIPIKRFVKEGSSKHCNGKGSVSCRSTYMIHHLVDVVVVDVIGVEAAEV